LGFITFQGRKERINNVQRVRNNPLLQTPGTAFALVRETKAEVFRQMTIIGWIVLGLIAGWLAGMLMRGGGYGIVGDIILGILGAIVGGWLTGLLLGRDMVNGFNIESLIVAVIGAVVLVAISRLFTGRRVGDRV
jgi:uncharacterized membrane protein YeaQ/YmgE (transglycosylase-associated protein family)